MRRETHDTVTLILEPEGEVARGAPGQFNMLYAFGAGEVPISLSGAAGKEGIMHTLRAVGAVTERLSATKRGGVIGLRGPFGTSWPLDEVAGRDVVIVAGGIGLAPLRPALEALAAQRRRYGRVALVYGARTPEDLLFERDLRRWRSRFDLQIEITVDSAPGGWRGNVGVVTTLLPHVPFDADNAAAFTCGPQIMMHFALAQLTGLGMPPERIYLSMERNMKCAVGFCGHCQFGPEFICKDGPVFRYDRIAPLLAVREV